MVVLLPIRSSFFLHNIGNNKPCDQEEGASSKIPGDAPSICFLYEVRYILYQVRKTSTEKYRFAILISCFFAVEKKWQKRFYM